MLMFCRFNIYHVYYHRLTCWLGIIILHLLISTKHNMYTWGYKWSDVSEDSVQFSLIVTCNHTSTIMMK